MVAIITNVLYLTNVFVFFYMTTFSITQQKGGYYLGIMEKMAMVHIKCETFH